MAKRPASTGPTPIRTVVFVGERGIQKIFPAQIAPGNVGEKAFGLSCLPIAWTLPFVVVSKDLLIQCRNISDKAVKSILSKWLPAIQEALQMEGILSDEPIIVRSSGCLETLTERGSLYSAHGGQNDLKTLIEDCLNRILNDKDLDASEVPFVIQRYAEPSTQAGHLSNELRLCKEARDWVVEVHKGSETANSTFSIAIRNWREKINSTQLQEIPLICKVSSGLKDTLKIPADWAHAASLRVHFEWVWNGSRVYVVQADRAIEKDGVNPRKISDKQGKEFKAFSAKFPTCLKKINERHAKKYHKVKNVILYRALGFPSVELYILDDHKLIADLAKGKVDQKLEADLCELVSRSLVIRMDLNTEDQSARQMLPRTNELREVSQAIDWLKVKSKEKVDAGFGEKMAFIFHNFVPAVSSAFVWASPDERKVQIESLWGIPEGLYYYAHDKYAVDTLVPDASHLKESTIDRFKISERVRRKFNFVAPERDGKWTTQIVEGAFYWRPAIKKAEWMKTIAFQSRKIAKKAGKPVSVMWFVEVPKSVCSEPIIPWFHEPFDYPGHAGTPTGRSKTGTHETLVIRTKADIEKLKVAASEKGGEVRSVRIEPKEDELLREKDTLEQIGKLAKEANAVILMEGGVLSHAYYQLVQTGATIEVTHPFDEAFEEVHEFNKLVRDKIPERIESAGEVVSKAKLTGEALLNSLKGKLAEESLEVLDAGDTDAILVELADVSEVIDGLLEFLGVKRATMESLKLEKRKKLGGFSEGVVLLKTDNPLPIDKIANEKAGLLKAADRLKNAKPLNEDEIFERSQKIDKWIDKRIHGDKSESILNVSYPVARNPWNVEADIGGEITVKVRGKRKGFKMELEISVFSASEPKEKEDAQLLFDFATLTKP